MTRIGYKIRIGIYLEKPKAGRIRPVCIIDLKPDPVISQAILHALKRFGHRFPRESFWSGIDNLSGEIIGGGVADIEINIPNNLFQVNYQHLGIPGRNLLIILNGHDQIEVIRIALP